ncbi:transposase [Rhodococcus sp. 1139]|uniref:transposase n=1 Tax=Rhodococcus sp. 1139 TaxID=1833762 RepID=UPI000ADB58B4|nr:transposase [Rhodococcus sp. 1139]
MPKRYPEEFRRKVLDLVAAGRPIAEIAHDLQVSDQTIYGWRKQDLIDTGQVPGLSRLEQSELTSHHPSVNGRYPNPPFEETDPNPLAIVEPKEETPW